MGYRKDIEQLIRTYIVTNNRQLITAAQLNKILLELTEKIKYFKDDPSVDKEVFKGFNNFFKDYTVYEGRSKDDFDYLDFQLKTCDPFYIGNVTFSDMKDIVTINYLRSTYGDMARQPEMADILQQLAVQIDPPLLTSSVSKSAYLFYLANVFLSASRQPKLSELFFELYESFGGPLKAVVTTPIEEMGRLVSVGGFILASVSNPEMFTFFLSKIILYKNPMFRDNPLIYVVRNFVIGVFIEAVYRGGNDLEINGKLLEVTKELIGEPILLNNIEYNFSDSFVMKKLSEGISRDPGMTNKLIDIVNELTNLNLTLSK